MAGKYPGKPGLSRLDLSPLQLVDQPRPDFIDEITTYESCLGHGSFGVVLKVKISKDMYAMKFILPNQVLTDGQKRRELEIPRTLEMHDNIVNIHKSVEKKVLSISQVKQILALSPPTI
ncbi:putative glycogen synthase kinase-3 [Folsomia candida]|uniref:Putative glycogen synthase kinase-3 n=1 Tax=Folsomia candida TaxID=158441 RepID=A0A226DWY7_FOLCA|nr:putative glycogen synthase kinase-3 [Folsomia candida]